MIPRLVFGNRLLFFLTALLLVATPVFAERTDAGGGAALQEYAKQVTACFRSVDVRNAESLYALQQNLMLPTMLAFELDLAPLKNILLREHLKLLEQTVSLGELRRRHETGALRLEPLLRSTVRGGRDSRRIFPTEQRAGIPVVRRIVPALGQMQVQESRLETFQYAYLLSFTLKESVRFGCEDPVLLEDFQKRAFAYLLNDVVQPLWEDVEAWHWYQPFRNMRERTKSRLNWKNEPFLQKYNYYRLFFDMDFFIFAIGADLSYVLLRQGKDNNGHRLQAASSLKQVLTEIQDATRAMFEQRLEPGEAFLFQIGVLSDHPEFAYAACPVGTELPSFPCPNPKVAPDTAHFHRFPWLLESYRDAFPEDSEGFRYYSNLLKRLAGQFSAHIQHVTPEGRVLLNNYTDGGNGWYRVRYEGRNWGYGPFTRSNTALYGSWSLLGRYDRRVRTFSSRLCDIIEATDPDTVAFRIKYYGLQKPEMDNIYGWGQLDSLAGNTLYKTNCFFLRRAGLLKESSSSR